MFLEGEGKGEEVIENAIRKSDQRSKSKTTVKHKHGRKVAKFPPSKIPFNAGFHVAKHPGRAALAGIAVIPKWNAEIEGGGVNNALICLAGVQCDNVTEDFHLLLLYRTYFTSCHQTTAAMSIRRI